MIIFLVGATSTPYLNNMSPRTNDSLLRKGVAPLVGADELIMGGWLEDEGTRDVAWVESERRSCAWPRRLFCLLTGLVRGTILGLEVFFLLLTAGCFVGLILFPLSPCPFALFSCTCACRSVVINISSLAAADNSPD
jgi:hypothetical protein